MTDVRSAELLLQDIAWLKRLATTIAHDRDDADDLVQEAWIAAWRRQPDATRPMRAWLTKVVRDLAGMKHRSERRRAAREMHADSAHAPATPDELLAQMRLHQELVRLVIELDEPYRSTVIQRFVEGRTSASIAQSLGVPAGTVRKRLHEAIARLRAGLEASAGERKRWAPAVLAFARGGMYVAKPIKLVVVIVGALLLATAAIVMLVQSGRSAGGNQAGATRAPEPTMSSRAMPAGARTNDAATAAPAPGSPGSEHHAAERAAMLEAIARARAARLQHAPLPTPVFTASGALPALGSDSVDTTLDIVDKTGDTSEWSKRALGTLNHLLGQCFDLGRAEDPNLTGSVTVEFTLVGEPKVGGLLESVNIVDANTTITQQTIRDCVTEQLYALELDPPPDGVTIKRAISLQVP